MIDNKSQKNNDKSFEVGIDELEISEVLLIKNPALIAKIKELKSDDTAAEISISITIKF